MLPTRAEGRAGGAGLTGKPDLLGPQMRTRGGIGWQAVTARESCRRRCP